MNEHISAVLNKIKTANEKELRIYNITSVLLAEQIELLQDIKELLISIHSYQTRDIK